MRNHLLKQVEQVLRLESCCGDARNYDWCLSRAPTLALAPIFGVTMAGHG